MFGILKKSIKKFTDRFSYIYILKDSTGVRYVGQSIHPKKRYYEHIWSANNYKLDGHRDRWIRKLDEEGNIPKLVALFPYPKICIGRAEKLSITVFRLLGSRLTNMTDGGELVYDRKGLKLTNKHKDSIRDNNGKSKKVLQLSLDDQIIREFPSMKQAAEAVKGNRSHISACCKGKRKTHLGYKWKYKKENNRKQILVAYKNMMGRTKYKKYN